MWPYLIVLGILWTASGRVLDETLTAQGLLGSHFGVPGIPGAYDYVVIGGGTAGLTVARRLAANTSVTVAVIEAGTFYEFSNGNLSEIPAYASAFTGSNPINKNPHLDWYQFTKPQPASASNFFSNLRCGTTGCYEKWAEQVGDEGYRFGNLLPYFQRSASFHPPDPTGPGRSENAAVQYNASDWNPSGGPVQVGYPSWVNPVSSWLGRSFTELGLQELSSFLSGTLLGWSWIAMTLDPVTQTRSSSEAFLREAFMKTTNLVIYPSTLAKKIIFENEFATGVIVDSGGVTYNITANVEVILSAGVIRSPQMLMVSGIGPKETLQDQDIEVLVHRPGVGQNMRDNVLVGPTYAVDVVTHDSLSDPTFLALAIQQYNTNRTGILTNVGGDIAGFEKFPSHMLKPSTYKELQDAFPSDWPHISYLVLDAYFGTGSDSSFAGLDGKQYVAASVGLVATFSQGNVTIASSDTAVNPIISPNWLSDPRDQELAVAAFRRARQLFSTNAMTSIVRGEAFPGTNFTTDAEILEVVRQSANSVYNAVGTNKMGKEDDPLAVVDSKGRVIGVNNLRVVDASIFPFVPVYEWRLTFTFADALAEKIAEDILQGV
ncbi:MAG: hypothetical protein M1816_005646 [Peltula sp. TS41687]|nr:MAG: hypothetical protein M1816_005646 [Peltula sp. TS41687]